ncbi:Hypothetical_protein [Hexamita inflata]|uniref:Hypothetical_protein n=1 Tax=Hexamita inflata TaxID=28002 RepID=A0AA86PYE0_9EUKA|nr:Hypothetical protein HINF_LOCUS33743 [Hexamita inflata]
MSAYLTDVSKLLTPFIPHYSQPAKLFEAVPGQFFRYTGFQGVASICFVDFLTRPQILISLSNEKEVLFLHFVPPEGEQKFSPVLETNLCFDGTRSVFMLQLQSAKARDEFLEVANRCAKKFVQFQVFEKKAQKPEKNKDKFISCNFRPVFKIQIKAEVHAENFAFTPKQLDRAKTLLKELNLDFVDEQSILKQLVFGPVRKSYAQVQHRMFDFKPVLCNYQKPEAEPVPVSQQKQVKNRLPTPQYIHGQKRGAPKSIIRNPKSFTDFKAEMEESLGQSGAVQKRVSFVEEDRKPAKSLGNAIMSFLEQKNKSERKKEASDDDIV